MRRLATACALVALVATPAAAAVGFSRSAATDLRIVTGPDGAPLVRVPVAGGGSIDVAVPGVRTAADLAHVHLTAHRGTGTPTPAAAQPSTAAAAPAAGPLAAEATTHYPADAPSDPGTVVSVAGGECDGYPARAATISPIRVAVDDRGRPWWIDDDGSDRTDIPDRRATASDYIRYVDDAGRVRTLGSVVAPEQGRAFRMGPEEHYLTDVIPDNHGGAYINTNIFSISTPPDTLGEPDTPPSGQLVHVRADGERVVLAGSIGPGETASGGSGPASGNLVPGEDQLAHAPLAYIDSLAEDGLGNFFFAEGAPITTVDSGVRIRYLNRSDRPVTFYPGTAYAVTVQPGHVGTVVGDSVFDPNLDSKLIDYGNGLPASKANIGIVPKIVVRGSLLYFLDVRHGDNPSYETGNPVEVRVVNLGYDKATKVVNSVSIAPGIIDRIAGDPLLPQGYAGDGGPARLASFDVDALKWDGDFSVLQDGSVVVSDSLDLRVRKIDPAGTISTVAGTGVAGESQEGVPAITAPVWIPFGITAESNGSLLFADYYNSQIRRLGADGSVTTVAGRGPTPCGYGYSAVGRATHDGAYFGHPVDSAVDAEGRTYVVDTAYNQIDRIGTDGKVDLVIGRPTRCAGPVLKGLADNPDPCPATGPRDGDNGPLATAGIGNPTHIAIDSRDNLFVADGDRIRYVNLTKKTVQLGGGISVPPLSVGTLRIFPGRDITITGVGFGQPYSVNVEEPLGDMVVDNAGNLYVADQFLDVVYRITPCAGLSIVAGNGSGPKLGGEGDGGPATGAAIAPASLAMDRLHNVLFIGDAGADLHAVGAATARVRAVNLGATGRRVYLQWIAPNHIDTVAGAGQCDAGSIACSFGDGGAAYDAAFAGEPSLAYDQGSDRLYLMDKAANRVRVLLPDGRIAGVTRPFHEHTGDADGAFNGGPDPIGYLGDGGPALQALFALRDVGGFPDGSSTYKPGGLDGLSIAPDGDLVIADLTGRVRRILDTRQAPLYFGPLAPAIKDAGRGFTPLLGLGVSTPGAANRTDGARDPVLVGDPSGPYVLGERGSGHGCALWHVRLATRDGKRDTAAMSTAPTPSAGGTGPGGRSCALAPVGSGGHLAVATPASLHDVGADAEGNRMLAIVTARTDDAGSTWTNGAAGVTTEQASTTQVDDIGMGAGPDGHPVIAYRAPDGGVDIATSTDGTSYTVTGHIAGTVIRIGQVLVDHGLTRVALVLRDGTGGAVAVAASHDLATWQVQRVSGITATADGAVRAAPPSLAADGAGHVWLAWSDDKHVSLSHWDGHRWTAPTLLPGVSVSVLPGIAATGDGRLAVGYYTAISHLVTSANDPYAAWFVGMSETADALSADPHWTARIATVGSIRDGALCLAETCPEYADTTTPAVPLGRVGPVRVLLGQDGRPELAASVDPAGLDNTTNGQEVGFIRACRSLLASSAAPCTANGPGAPPPVAPSCDVPGGALLPACGAPDVPRVPDAGLLCGAVPPPFAPQVVTKPPARQHHQQPPPNDQPPRPAHHQPAPAVPLQEEHQLVAAAVVAPAPPEPAGVNQIPQGAQNAQQAGQQQGAPQAGSALQRDEEAQVATATERHDDAEAGFLLMASLLATGAAATAYALGRRGRLASGWSHRR